MEITTKYKIGDNVWVMHNNAPVLTFVDNVQTTTMRGGSIGETIETVVKYRLNINNLPNTTLHKENIVFSSKEELIASL